MKQTALALLVGGALVVGFAGQASATDQNNGCPSSYSPWIVGSTPPYQADEYVDEKGNDDNIVCAKLAGNKTFVYEGSAFPSLDGQTFPLYDFVDNKAAAS